ncbi:MAG: hypothetical protein ABS49_13090 [Erythrobacter sp. SCN 62-14]|nr:MAG: hypothetical protein ABS49_13090 [Erythrobacter sp. SCN 62-14]
MSGFVFQLLGTLRKAWVRIVGFALLALVTAITAQYLGPLLPPRLSEQMGVEAVEDILKILTSSMLAVTTFSLSVAVSAFAAAASSATPRATALLQEDPTTQNVLATFLGAFLFGLLGLIGLKAQLYDGSGRLVLFVATVIVVALVVIALIRWIDHLMVFGLMSDTLRRIEKAAASALQDRLDKPYLGGQPDYRAAPPQGQDIAAHATGYVQHIDMGVLQESAAAAGGQLHLLCLPGSFVVEGTPILVLVGGAMSDEQGTATASAVIIGDKRTFREDPRFGLLVLTEIASRALSPAVNDPGTAIDVIGRLLRILARWQQAIEPALDYPAVFVPPISPAEVVEEAFRPIARDGAANVEVQIRLHKALIQLSGLAPAAFAEAARAMSAYALDQACVQGISEADLAAIQRVIGREAQAWLGAAQT